MDLTQQQKAQEFLVKIYTEAWRDESFKKKFNKFSDRDFK